MPDKSSKAQKSLIAVAGGAALGLLAVVGMFEGKSNDPYLDIVEMPTVCYGETSVPMRHYTDAECSDLLAVRLTTFARGVLKRNPELQGHDPQLLAATSLAYNIGLTNYNRSTVAKDFSAGKWRAACDAFPAWSYAGGRRIAGLVTRRQKERSICLRNMP